MPAMLLGEFYNTHTHTHSELTEGTNKGTDRRSSIPTFGNPSISPDPAIRNDKNIKLIIIY